MKRNEKGIVKKFFVSSSILVLVVSCKKEQDKVDPVVERTNILTAGTWRLSDYKYFGYTIVEYANLPDCEKDNLISFNKDGTGENNEGPTKCNIASPQTQPMQWRFLNNYASSFEMSGIEYYIDKLENNEFRFHRKHLDPYAPEISYGYSR